MTRHLPVAVLVIAIVSGCTSSTVSRQSQIGTAYLALPEPGAAPDAPAAETHLPEPPDDPAPSPTDWPPLVSGLDLASDSMKQRLQAARGDDFAARVADGIDLPTLIAGVLARHPDIATARARVQAEQTAHTELDALMRVRTQYRAFTDQLDGGLRAGLPPASTGAGYPLPGAEGLRSRLVDRDVAISRAALHATARRLVNDARHAFAAVAFQQTRHQVFADQLQLAESLLAVMTSRFETGNADLGSVLALQARIARLADTRDDAERELASGRATLASLLAISGSPVGAATSNDPSAPDSTAITAAITDARLAANPDARILELKRERVATMQELIETMTRPDADLDLSGLPSPLADRPAFRNQPARMPPGPWFGLMEARRAELAFRATALGHAHTALIDRLRADASSTSQQAATARAELALQRDTLDALARQSIEATTEAFRAGRLDVDRVLSALTQRLDAALGAAAARRDVATTLATIDYLLGPA